MRWPRIGPPRIEPARPGETFHPPGTGPYEQETIRYQIDEFWHTRWKRCPSCNERIRRAAVVCKHCHRDVG